MSYLSYQGFYTLEVSGELIEDFYCDGKIRIEESPDFHPNLYVELRDEISPKHTAIGKIDSTGEWICKIKEPKVHGIKPRNREQSFALDALTDDDISVVALTGCAGSGKTILTMAMAVDKRLQKKYDKVIITRPMSQVGKYDLGALPGGIQDKFGPYLQNYDTNLTQLIPGTTTEDIATKMNIEIVPLQFFRGASFNKCLVICDEVQILGAMEILTIGTRIGEGSKLILLGDMDQRDEPIAKEKTGLYQFINHPKVKASPIVACIELQQCVRSETARLFSSVFSGE